MHTWTHDGLAADLAGYLRSPDRMVWLDMQLGPSGSPRPDVFTLQRSYSKPQPTAFEVKVSRSDLRADTTAGKWQSYLKYAGSVTFAVPDGLCTPADIPNGCGLIVRKAEVWRYARKPTVQRVSLPMDACMKLLIDGVSRVSRGEQPQSRTVDLWRENESVRRKFGEAVEKAARDLVAVERRIASLLSDESIHHDTMRKQVEAQRASLLAQARSSAAEFEAAKRALCEWLGVDPEKSSTFSVRQRIVELKATCDADLRVERAEVALEQARRSIRYAAAALEPPASKAAA